MKKILKTDLDWQNSRIDKFLKKNFSTLNQSFIEKNLRKGLIKVNNKKVQAKYKLKEDDEIDTYKDKLQDAFEQLDKFQGRY